MSENIKAYSTEETPQIGSKFDEDLYKKPDLSLIPFEILRSSFTVYDAATYQTMKIIHNVLNDKNSVDIIPDVFKLAIDDIGTDELAISLGYGVVKYERDNWRKGFGGDWRRFLRATLRHCNAVLCGKKYDSEAVEGYPQGNSHKGAVLFSLMVAKQEIERSSF